MKAHARYKFGGSGGKLNRVFGENHLKAQRENDIHSTWKILWQLRSGHVAAGI